MNKTNKFLYGGFGVVALAGIVAMLVSIFSPPTQIVKGAAEMLKLMAEKQIEDVPNQMEQWQRNVEAARKQREANEAWAKYIQAEEDTKLATQEKLDKAKKNGGKAGKTG